MSLSLEDVGQASCVATDLVHQSLGDGVRPRGIPLAPFRPATYDSAHRERQQGAWPASPVPPSYGRCIAVTTRADDHQKGIRVNSTTSDSASVPTSPPRSKRRRPLLGWFLFGLGLVGSLGCIAAGVALWIGCQRVGVVTDDLVARLSGQCRLVEERAGVADGWIGESRQAVGEVEAHLVTGTTQLLASAELDLAWFDGLEQDLQTHVTTLREWLLVARSVADLVEELLGVLDSLVVGESPLTEVRTDVDAALQGAREQVDSVTQLLVEFRTELTAIRSGVAQEVRTGPLRELSTRIDDALAVLQQEVRSFIAEVTGLREFVETMRAKVRRGTLLVSGALTLLLLWQGAAQGALAAWGWRLARRRLSAGSTTLTGG